MTHRRTVVYVLSLPRSGSTLLGSVLGCHSRIWHIGEVVAPLRKQNHFECRSCGAACPLWGTTLDERFVRTVYDEFIQWCRGGKQDDSKPASLAGSLYSRILDRYPDSRVVCDSSKNVPWVRYNALQSSLRHRHLFLWRDPRACWAGIKRTWPGTYREKLPGLRRKLLRLRRLFLACRDEDRLVIRYDDFVRQPALHVQRLCGWLGLRCENAMLEFNRHAPHVIGGNPALVLQHKHVQQQPAGEWVSALPAPRSAYYVPRDGGFLLDERWKSELTAADLDLYEEEFRELGGPFTASSSGADFPPILP